MDPIVRPTPWKQGPVYRFPTRLFTSLIFSPQNQASENGRRNITSVLNPWTNLCCLRHVSDDAIREDEEDEVAGAVLVGASKAGHMVYHGCEVGRAVELHLPDTAPVCVQHTWKQTPLWSTIKYIGKHSARLSHSTWVDGGNRTLV